MGVGKELVTSEVPTLRAALQLALYFQREWERAKLAARNKLNKVQKAELESKLGKLLDPPMCLCQPIQKCSDVGCLGPKKELPCLVGGLLTFSCPKENKIPKLELLFVKSQRAKVGERGGMQIASVDVKEDLRQRKEAARKESVISIAAKTNEKEKTKAAELAERVEEENNLRAESGW